MVGSLAAIKKILRDYSFYIWLRSDVGVKLTQYSKAYFKDHPVLSKYSEKAVKDIVDEFLWTVFDLSQEEDAFMAMRELFSIYAWDYAAERVVTCTAQDKESCDMFDHTCISGQLHHHVKEIVHYDKKMRFLIPDYASLTHEQLLLAYDTRSAINLYHLKGMNIVRDSFNDLCDKEDWMVPFIQSMMVWEENVIRKQIGLESILPCELHGLRHSSFLNIVAEGCKEPLEEWNLVWSEA